MSEEDFDEFIDPDANHSMGDPYEERAPLAPLPGEDIFVFEPAKRQRLSPTVCQNCTDAKRVFYLGVDGVCSQCGA